MRTTLLLALLAGTALGQTDARTAYGPPVDSKARADAPRPAPKPKLLRLGVDVGIEETSDRPAPKADPKAGFSEVDARNQKFNADMAELRKALAAAQAELERLRAPRPQPQPAPRPWVNPVIPVPAQGVPVPQPFRGQDVHHPDHRCPACGFQSAEGGGTWVVRGFLGDGTHRHVCPRCGQSWRH